MYTFVLERPFKLGFLVYFLTCCFSGSILAKLSATFKASLLMSRGIIYQKQMYSKYIIGTTFGNDHFSAHETIHVKVLCKQL